MKSLNFILILAVLTFIAVPFIHAEVEENFRYNTKFDLKRPCFNNGTFCASSSSCNLTIIYPDGVDGVMVDNQAMSFAGSYWNYTVGQVFNNELGEHPTIISCTDGSLSGADTFEIDITADGFPRQQFPLQFTLVIFGVFFIVIGSLKDRLRLMKHLGSIFIMIMGVITLYPGFSYINYSNLMGQSLGAIFVGMGFYFMVEDSFSRDRQTETYDAESEGVFQ